MDEDKYNLYTQCFYIRASLGWSRKQRSNEGQQTEHLKFYFLLNILFVASGFQIQLRGLPAVWDQRKMREIKICNVHSEDQL